MRPTGCAAFLAATLLLSGCAAPDGRDAAASTDDGTEPFALYLTDAPANVTALEVVLEQVLIGGVAPIALTLVAPAFDLLAHRGVGQALLVAQGTLPIGSDRTVEATFASVTAVVDGQRIALPAEALRWAGPNTTAAQAVLLDIDVGESLVSDASGALRFEPAVAMAYTSASPVPVGPDAGSAASVTGPPAPPQDVWEAGPSSAAADAWQPGGVAVPVHAEDGLPSGGVADDLSPANEVLDAGPLAGYLVQFRSDADTDDMKAAAAESKSQFVLRFQSLPAAYMLATDAGATQLRNSHDVVHVEPDVFLTLDDVASRKAIRADLVQSATAPLTDASGATIDGRGIGVAVVDTGIDGTHQDLRHWTLPGTTAVALNLKFGGDETVDLPNTDTTSGHGTHVAGIVAGRGVGNADGRGVAPGATLYGLGIGEAPRLLWAAQALDWVLQNHNQVTPAIRVVQNSWSSSTSYDPNAIVNVLANQLVDEGIVVVFSAGNLGGDGTVVRTSGYCQNPKAGVVCVANYDDLGTGTRDGTISPDSSRGLSSHPTTWPDISAPGTVIRSTTPTVGLTTGVQFGYIALSGTSMAAPHTSGAVALMLQADGALTPAQVERMLRSTGYKFTDGGSYLTPYGTAQPSSHPAKGSGLLDAYAAVQAALAP